MMNLAFIIFWICFGVIAYTFMGFPLMVAIRSVLLNRPIHSKAYTPKVSIVIAAYNEVLIIKQKLDNIFSLNYPIECFEVILASDGSDDGTDEVVKAYNGGPVKLISLPRQGKNQTLNDAVEVAFGEILVFTDADTMFKPDALNFLVAPFNDPEVGGVAGNYVHNSNGGRGKSERDFWSLERVIKLLQSRAGSVTSAWGPIYAIRKSFYKRVPIGVTDDFFISIQPLIHHFRLVFEPRALATGPVADEYQTEFRRKVRIISAGLRGVLQTRQLLNPFVYGYLSLQIFSHKVMRRLMGFPISLLFVTSLVLFNVGFFYKVMSAFQLIFHILALLGFILNKSKIGQLKLLRLPFFFDMVYTASMVALLNLILGNRFDIWTPQKKYEN